MKFSSTTRGQRPPPQFESVVLQKLCERMDREQQIRQRLISAVTYPVGILVVGLTMVAFMATYMLPRFLESAGSALSDPPWPTRVLIAVSDNSGVLVMSSLMVLASLPWLASEVPAAVAIRTWILYRSPVVGTAMGLLERARLCNEFGLLLDAGLTVHRAMKCLVLGDPRLRDALKRATRYLVEGSSLSESFAQTGAFSPTFVAIIEVGEETGRLSKSLVQQAGLLEETAERYIDGAVKMIEPVVMIILGFFVGFVVLGCFLPIYKMVAENL